jgi:hypothetical protein
MGPALRRDDGHKYSVLIEKAEPVDGLVNAAIEAKIGFDPFGKP